FRSDTADTATFQDVTWTANWAGLPLWLMLVRSGDRFDSYFSSDGDNWTFIGSATIVMPSTIYAGLAVSSHDNSVLNTGTFDNVQLVSTGPPLTVTVRATDATA